MKKIYLILMLLSFSFYIASCGSMGKKIEKERIAKVKRVAIISFEVVQDQPADNLGLGALTKGSRGEVTDANSQELQAFAKDTYNKLVMGVQDALKVKVISYKQVSTNKSYKSFYNKKMSGLRPTTFMGSANVEIIHAKGILDRAAFQALPHNEKVKLVKDIGADAFIEYSAFQDIKQGWGLGNLVGKGSFSFTTKSSLVMYDLNSDEPILRVQNINGIKSRSSSEIKTGSQISKLAIIGKESARTSLEAVFKTIQ